jgi:hypothetical protein
VPNDPFEHLKQDVDNYGWAGKEEWERDAEELERLSLEYREEVLASKKAFDEFYSSLSVNLIDVLPGFTRGTTGERREPFKGDKEVRVTDINGIPGDAVLVYRDVRSGRGHARVVHLKGPQPDDVFDELCVYSYELSNEIEPLSFWEKARELFIR